MKNLLLSIAMAIFAWLPLLPNQVYRTTISNLHINSFAQDEQGFMWIATAKGLCRYDGYGFNIFSHDAGDANSIPSDNVMGLYVDANKRMWVATGDGVCLYDIDRMRFDRFRTMSDTDPFILGMFEYKKQLYAYGLGGIYRIDEQHRQTIPVLKLEGREVWSVNVDSNNNIWCVCDKGEVYCFDGSMNLLRKFDFGWDNEPYCATLVHPGKCMLVGTKRGLVEIDTETLNVVKEIYDFNGNSLDVSCLTEMGGGKNIFILGTKNKGLVFFDLSTGKVVDSSNLKIRISPDSNDIRCLSFDNSGFLWVGSFDKGFYIGTHEDKVFNNESPLCDTLHSRFVTRIVDDKAGNLWVGTRYFGILRYDKASRKSTWFNSGNIPQLAKYKGNFVQSLLVDSNNRLWIGYEQSVVVADISGGSFKILRSFDSTGNVVTMAEDSKHRIWTGKSSGGITIYDADLQPLESFTPVLGHNNITKIIRFDGDDMLFSAFGDNIYKININTLKTTVLNQYYKNSWKNAVTLYKDNRGNVWIGTYGSGLLRYSIADGLLLSYKRNESFQSNDIIGITEDNAGRMWLSSSYGIYCMNQGSNRVQAFFSQDGVSGDQMHEKCVLKSRDGSLYFGGNGGLTEITPGNIKPAPVNIPVLLTDFRLFNHIVAVDGSDNILDKVISRTDKIVLRHDQSVFSLDFTGLTYAVPPRLNYAYRLVGFDKEWNYVGAYNRASYSNLSSGEYEFEVMVQNKDGVWTQPKKLLKIRVLPSPWVHPAAICGYMVIAMVILFYSLKIYVRLKLGKERYAMAQKEIAREKQLAQMKMNFFTNISHELRTPLTMIYGPVKTLIANKGTTSGKEYSSLLALINSNVERLLRLVDQLLDFGHVTNDTLALKVSRNDCIQQLTSIINLYRLYVADKNITVDFDCPYDSLNIVYDPDKLDKIMNNLLFNASKYTPVGGHVVIRAEVVSDTEGFNVDVDSPVFLKVSVEDDGIGLKVEQVETVFERFKRLVKGKPAEQIKGSGIGLNFVKHLVENHKGDIKAENCSEKGCKFTFVIPVDDSAYSEEEHAFGDERKAEDELPEIAHKEGTSNDGGGQEEGEEAGKNTILVVEDNEEVRKFLNDMLRLADYEVVLAVDGVDGLQKAVEIVPDVIISDVIMPNMDGYELCHQIKTNRDLCHIPVVLLTAKKLDSDQIEGYKQGADMYLAKPFNPDVLLSILSNMIQSSNRRKQFLMQHSGTTAVADETVEQEPDLSPLDKKFLNKLYDYIDSNISNSELNVNLLGRELGFSRTNFYRKVKALTGATPNDFLRVYRLNRAAELIKRREFTLSEISEMAGFGTQSHFSTSFKKYFGVSPKDYLSVTKKA